MLFCKSYDLNQKSEKEKQMNKKKVKKAEGIFLAQAPFQPTAHLDES
jgi:hypothetical protein